MTNVLQFDFAHSPEQVTQAKVRLKEIHDHEAQGVAIRHKSMRAAQGSKMTKGHFKHVKKSQHNPALSQMKSIMNNQGDVVSTQSEIEAAVSAYWKHVMRHRPTCPIAVAQVKASITKVLPDNSELDSPLHSDDQEDFVTQQAITRSIHSMQLDSSPGIDGLPIEFYECLLRADSEDSPQTH